MLWLQLHTLLVAPRLVKDTMHLSVRFAVPAEVWSVPGLGVYVSSVVVRATYLLPLVVDV